MTTHNQPTAMPTRKVMAGMITGLSVAILQVLFARYLPDINAMPLVAALEPFIAPAAMTLAAYIVPEKMPE
ncbi:MAG: hypothetical protein AAFQ36_09415 [Pseudomonadota bacterium]